VQKIVCESDSLIHYRCS